MGSVVECLTLDQGAAGSSLTGVTALSLLARHINPSLLSVQHRKTCPFITERLLMGLKESNQTIQTIRTGDWLQRNRLYRHPFDEMRIHVEPDWSAKKRLARVLKLSSIILYKGQDKNVLTRLCG